MWNGKVKRPAWYKFQKRFKFDVTLYKNLFILFKLLLLFYSQSRTFLNNATIFLIFKVVFHDVRKICNIGKISLLYLRTEDKFLIFWNGLFRCNLKPTTIIDFGYFYLWRKHREININCNFLTFGKKKINLFQIILIINYIHIKIIVFYIQS